ncbi:MAG: PqiC family protein [Akkermansiaceae bacterium]
MIFPAFLLLASCSSQRSYYVLSPAGPSAGGKGPGIGVGPVTMANYLTERPYLVFQSTPNKMEISDLHVWGGDLERDFARVLATNLGRHTGSGHTVTYPWSNEGELKYQVVVDVRQLHGTPDGNALIEAAWRAYELPGGRLITSRTTTLREPLRKDGFEELAAAHSRLIDRLAEVVAGQLRR